MLGDPSVDLRVHRAWGGMSSIGCFGPGDRMDNRHCGRDNQRPRVSKVRMFRQRLLPDARADVQCTLVNTETFGHCILPPVSHSHVQSPDTLLLNSIIAWGENITLLSYVFVFVFSFSPPLRTRNLPSLRTLQYRPYLAD